MTERPSDVLAGHITPERRDRMDRVLAGRTRNITLVLENLYDPHNISAVIRSAEALGIQDVHIVETQHKFKFSRGITRGCEKWLTIHRYKDAVECAAALHEKGYRIAVSDHRPGTSRIEDLDPLPKRAFWMGAEHFGVSDDAYQASDERFGIPMSGFTESFNVSVASALTLYTARTQWERKTGLAGDLTDDEREALRLQWLRGQLSGADHILARYDVGDDRKGWRTRLVPPPNSTSHRDPS